MFRSWAGALLLSVVGAAWLAESPAQAEPPPPLVVMTYNLRYASPLGPNSWPTRRPLVAGLIRRHAPDVFGTQEGLYPQLKDLAADLADYQWIGLGRDGGSRGEFMAIFYKPSRLEPVEYDHFWLSDTPGVIASTTWGNSNRRMVTWVRFKDRAAKREFYFFNTHFDHQIQPAREKSAELVLERVKKLKTELPIVLVGDFNAAAGANKAYEILVGPDRFLDAWDKAEHKGDQVQSFNGFRFPTPKEGPRIDWILTKGPIAARSIETDAFHQDGQYPSDHFPVIATLEYR